MRYGFISDIHGNLEGLSACLAELADRDVDEYWCLGDVVGYMADPRECIKVVRELGATVVAGNHDQAAIGKASTEYFNEYARRAIEWTAGELTEKERAFLDSLPLVEVGEHFTAVHATLEEPEEWNYVRSTFEAHRNLELSERPMIFYGHSHVPIWFQDDRGCRYYHDPHIELSDGSRYMINVGSSGQPRDGDPRAACAVYDTEEGEVDIIRVEYDIEKTQAKVTEAGLPPVLALRLERGE